MPFPQQTGKCLNLPGHMHARGGGVCLGNGLAAPPIPEMTAEARTQSQGPQARPAAAGCSPSGPAGS